MRSGTYVFDRFRRFNFIAYLSFCVCLVFDFEGTIARITAVYESIIGDAYEPVSVTFANKCALLFSAAHDCCKFFYTLACVENSVVNASLIPVLGLRSKSDLLLVVLGITACL